MVIKALTLTLCLALLTGCASATRAGDSDAKLVVNCWLATCDITGDQSTTVNRIVIWHCFLARCRRSAPPYEPRPGEPFAPSK